MSAITPTMKLITSAYQGKKSFGLMPISKDCPYTEGLFDPEAKILVLISTNKKESFHMLPLMDPEGKPVLAKNGKEYKRERKLLETYTEYYITEKVEIEEALKDHAVNAGSFDYAKYLEGSTIVPGVEKPQIELIGKE